MATDDKIEISTNFTKYEWSGIPDYIGLSLYAMEVVFFDSKKGNWYDFSDQRCDEKTTKLLECFYEFDKVYSFGLFVDTVYLLLDVRRGYKDNLVL